jgi:hypothetical protein
MRGRRRSPKGNQAHHAPPASHGPATTGKR